MGNIPFELYQHATKKGKKQFLSLILEPQFNFNISKPINDRPSNNVVPDETSSRANQRILDIEFGVNVGLRYDYKIFKRQFIYCAVGTGPHYISLKTKMQARGFIFSDNFVFGTYRQLEKIKLNLQVRYRHMSNASLMHPNKGIDNFFILAGASFPINK